MNYGKAIKTIRTLRNISQTKLGEGTGLSKSYISKIEAGKSTPTLDTLEAISKELKVPFYMLMFFASEKADLKAIPESTSDEMKKILFDMVVSLEDKPRNHGK